jgi:hypothetical protein
VAKTSDWRPAERGPSAEDWSVMGQATRLPLVPLKPRPPALAATISPCHVLYSPPRLRRAAPAESRALSAGTSALGGGMPRGPACAGAFTPCESCCAPGGGRGRFGRVFDYSWTGDDKIAGREGGQPRAVAAIAPILEREFRPVKSLRRNVRADNRSGLSRLAPVGFGPRAARAPPGRPGRLAAALKPFPAASI